MTYYSDNFFYGCLMPFFITKHSKALQTNFVLAERGKMAVNGGFS
jgi:hypothetical protein